MRCLREREILPPLSFGRVAIIRVGGFARLFAAKLYGGLSRVFAFGLRVFALCGLGLAGFRIGAFLGLLVRLPGIFAIAFGIVAEIIRNLKILENRAGELREGLLV